MKWTSGPFLEIPDNERAWDSFLESPANFSCANLVPRVLFSKVKEKRPGDEVVRARIGVLCLPYICIQLQSFVNFENDTIELSVKEAKLTGL